MTLQSDLDGFRADYPARIDPQRTLAALLPVAA